MPPRHASSSTKTAGARKRKNADRSDDQDSDFDYPQYRQRMPQREAVESQQRKPGRPRRQQQQPLERNHQQQIVSSTTQRSNGTFEEEQESWRTELSELKRAKRFTEEDRGFVFTRKKTTTATTNITSSSAAALSSKAGPPARTFHEAENPLLSTPNPPPTPEGTPSRDKIYDNRVQSSRAPPANSLRPAAPVATKKQQHQQRPQQRQQIPQTPDINRESIVTIPMRETPMIKRNKDMRNDTSRRSSFTLRGKRASSIGSGLNVALPHPSIDPKSFFRHIAPDEPPPLRMKQLMAWCARKTIDEQRGGSQSALKIAKQIEEDTLAMLNSGQFSVSWYSRPLDSEPIRRASRKPHQQNVENHRKLKEGEAQIEKLLKEDEEWTRVISSFNTFHASLLDNGPAIPPGDEAIVVPEAFTDEIDVDLLTADERSLWEKHCKNKELNSTPGSTPRTPRNSIGNDGTKRSSRDNKWMLEMMGSLEKEVDNLQDTLYAASRFDKIAKQYTDQVLEQIATALDERQRPAETLPLFSSRSPSSLSSSSKATVTSTLLSGSAGKGTSSLLSKQPSSSASHSAVSIAAPGMVGSDGADDARQILRALSRLSL